MNKYMFAPAILAAAVSTGVFAGADDPSVQVENVNATIPDTGVIAGIAFTNDADAGQEAVAGQFDIVELPDNAGVTATGEVFNFFTSSWVSCASNQTVTSDGGITVSCAPVANGTRFIIEDPSNNPIANFPFANVARMSIDVAGGASAGTTPLVIQGENWTFASGSDMSAGEFGGNNSNGSVTLAITGAAGYASTPSSGGPAINVGAALIGDVADATGADITVSEIGDQTLTVSAAPLSGANAADFAVATAVPFDIVDGGAPVGVDLNCTPTARGARLAAVELTNNSVNEPNPVYQLSCAGLTPDVSVAPTSVALNGLISDPAPPSDTVTVSNANDPFSAPADVTPSVVGDMQITVSPAAQTIAPGASVDYTIQCDRSAAGNFSATVNFASTDANGNSGDTDSVSVTCEILDAVPSYAGTPPSGSTITFPATTNGTTSAPIGIDVANDGVGPSPTSDLDITSATVADAVQFGVTVNNSGPFIVGQPATADAIEVTCSPSGGATGTISTTLTIVHNGDDTDATYTLECPTASDAAFTSSPADGGTLNLGVVPPLVMTPPGDITFTNAGAADTFDVDCTVTDADGVFTFTPDPISFSIAPGTSEAATFQCTPAAPQIYQADVACTITGADVATANYTVACQGQPLVVPTMNRWGLILMAMFLLALGGLAGRRMMA